MKSIKLPFLFAIILMVGCSKKQESTNHLKINSFIHRAMDSITVVPSLAIAIVDSTGVVMTKGFGKSDIENNILATKKTNFYIASTTKSFVGLLSVILDQEGYILLDKEITSYKPFNKFKNNEVFKNISIIDLLTHQSGLDNGFLSFRLAYSGSYSRADILRIIEDYTFLREEGNDFEYTNLGYYLYSIILKEELGEKWQDLVDQKIFTPLQMEMASAYISESPKELTAQPYYGVFPDSFKKSNTVKTDETMHAAGGLMMNAEDVAKFIQFYLNNGKLNNSQIYPEEYVKKSYQKQVETDKLSFFYDADAYGLGWLHANYKGHKMVNHLGGYVGYKASISFFPDDKLGVAVFSNHNELGRSLGNTVAEYIYELYLGDASTIHNHETKLINELMESMTSRKKRELEENEKWKTLQWNLTLSKDAYSGNFYNDKDGTITVTHNNGKIVVENGNLMAIGKPHGEKDCMQVELISTSKKTLCFKVVNGEVQGIKFRDKFFKKILSN